MTWEAAWSEGRTGWDAGKPSPSLTKLIEDDLLPDGRALVPGCGSGYDVFALASPRRFALGLDIAPTARERFLSLREERGVPPEHAEIHIGDFFDFSPDAPFDLAFDYTFLCAIPPERRTDWATRMAELIRPGGQLVTLVFPVRDPDPEFARHNTEGPPYAMHPELVRELLDATRAFEPIAMRPAHDSHSGREGKEWLARWSRRS